MKLFKVVFMAVLVIFPTAAFCKGKGHLYNLKTGETIALEFTRGIWTGHGKIWATYTNGNKLEGEYSVTRQGFSSWGTIYANGSSGNAFASSSSNVAQGSAILSGKDTLLQCEFLTGGLHGSGSCRDQAGDFYKFIF